MRWPREDVPGAAHVPWPAWDEPRQVPPSLAHRAVCDTQGLTHTDSPGGGARPWRQEPRSGPLWPLRLEQLLRSPRSPEPHPPGWARRPDPPSDPPRPPGAQGRAALRPRRPEPHPPPKTRGRPALPASRARGCVRSLPWHHSARPLRQVPPHLSTRSCDFALVSWDLGWPGDNHRTRHPWQPVEPAKQGGGRGPCQPAGHRPTSGAGQVGSGSRWELTPE